MNSNFWGRLATALGVVLISACSVDAQIESHPAEQRSLTPVPYRVIYAPLGLVAVEDSLRGVTCYVLDAYPHRMGVSCVKVKP